jgi:hypothetical protein
MSHALTDHAAIPDPRSTSLRRDLAAGALAGQAAGLVMAVVIMAVFTFVLGEGPLYPVQLIGSLVFGDVALDGLHLGALLVGLVLHQLGPSLAWGLAFGFAVDRLEIRRGPAFVALAVVTGLVSQLVDVGVLVPAAMGALHGHDLWAEHVPAFWSWAAHGVFGLGLLTFAPIAARLAARPPAGGTRR